MPLPHAHAEPALALTRVTVRREGRIVVQDLSLTIQKGEKAALLGHNGAGKTTLIEAVLGLLPYEGSIRVFGTEACRRDVHLPIGYVPQHIHTVPYLPVTVEELAASACGKHHYACELHPASCLSVEDALKETGLLTYRKEKLGNLSGGLRQRAFIARALTASSHLFIMDEPMTGLDSASRKQFYTLVSRLCRDHDMTLLFATHEEEDLKTYGITSIHLPC